MEPGCHACAALNMALATVHPTARRYRTVEADALASAMTQVRGGRAGGSISREAWAKSSLASPSTATTGRTSAAKAVGSLAKHLARQKLNAGQFVVQSFALP